MPSCTRAAAASPALRLRASRSATPCRTGPCTKPRRPAGLALRSASPEGRRPPRGRPAAAATRRGPPSGGMRIPVTVVLAALLAAGCLGDGDGPPGDLTDAPVGADGYAVDCSIGSPDWVEPCLAWSSRNESPSKAEIDLAVNPTDPLNVFVASKDMDPLASPGPCVWAVGQVTHDGGRTWSTVYVGGTMDEREPVEPLFGWRCITDPSLQFTSEGRLHYSLQAYDYEPVVETPPIGAGGFELEGGNMYTALSTDG